MNNINRIGVNIVPPKNLWFEPFRHFKVVDTKAIIVVDYPERTEGVHDGLAGSHPPHVTKDISPIAYAIRSEYLRTVSRNAPHSYCLLPWAKQGVLLMYMCPVAEQDGDNRKRFKNYGWAMCLIEVLTYFNNYGTLKKVPVVFIGKDSHKFAWWTDRMPTLLLDYPSKRTNRARNEVRGSGFIKWLNDNLDESHSIDWKLP